MQIDQAFPSKYLRAADLGGGVVPVVIDRLEQELVGRDKELKPVLFFRGKTKGLVLNKTNARRIAELLAEQNTDDWTGHRVALFAVDVEFEGKSVPAIRVKAAPVQPAPRRAGQPAPPMPKEQAAPWTDDDIDAAFPEPEVP